MTCEEAIRAIEAMIDREIDDDERMQLEAHLAGCEGCRRETEERRAFSERLGRDLVDAIRPPAPASRRVIIRPRRFPWVRAAAVILVGIVIGYAGAAGGLFNPASAEAREVANLSALKDAYAHRDQELATRLEKEAGDLDRRVATAPDGAVKDAVALCVMNAASGLAGEEPLVLPQEPERRAYVVARQLSERDWSRRGLAVQAFRRLLATDASHVESQIVNLNGANRIFAELWVRSMKAPSEPAVECTVETDQGVLRVVQHRNARLRVETVGAAAPRVFEGDSLLEFRSRNPAIARQLRLRGVDGNFTVVGVHQFAPAVESRPAMFVPAVVWSAPGGESGEFVKAMTVHAVMSDLARAGRSVEETERQAVEVMRRVDEASVPVLQVVRADPERVRIHLAALSRLDRAHLSLARERLHDDVAALERRVQEMERRIDCLRKAAVTLEYAPR